MECVVQGIIETQVNFSAHFLLFIIFTYDIIEDINGQSNVNETVNL